MIGLSLTFSIRTIAQEEPEEMDHYEIQLQTKRFAFAYRYFRMERL
jgi:hypothetical protein